MYDISKSYANVTWERKIKAGEEVAAEGQCLIYELEDGQEVVAPSGGVADEVFAGFSTFATVTPTYKTVVIPSVTVPAVSPYVLQLEHNNLVTGQIRVVDLTAGAALTLVAIAPAAGEAQVNYTSGTVTLHSSAASHSLKIIYKYNLTVAQAVALAGIYGQGFPTNQSSAALGQVGVMKGNPGLIFTDQFDASVDYSGGKAYTGANGMLTSDSTGCEVGRVVQEPTEDSPYLGVEYYCK